VVAGGVTLYKDSLTTKSRTVFLTGNTSLTLVPNVAFTSTGSSINEADVNVVPEPSTLLSVLIGVLTLAGYACRRQRSG